MSEPDPAANAAEEEEEYYEGEAYPSCPADARYDNIPQLAKALDLHLMFPLVQFLEDRAVYDGREIMKAKLEMLEATHMARAAARSLRP